MRGRKPTQAVHLRGARKQCRRSYGTYDRRGRLAGKWMIGERPAVVERRRQLGHLRSSEIVSKTLIEVLGVDLIEIAPSDRGADRPL
jgi:IS30 family transposase